MYQKRLAAGLRPDPPGDLTALPRPWLDLRGRGRDKVRGRDKTRGRRTGEGDRVKGGGTKSGRRKGREGDEKGKKRGG